MKNLTTVLCFFLLNGFLSAQIQLGSDIIGVGASDRLGEGVAISADGDRIVVGTPGTDNGGFNKGNATIYQWDGTDWAPLGNPIVGAESGDQSGSTVALSADGSRVVIGAAGGGNMFMAGQARIFDYNGIEWTQVGSSINGLAQNDLFGTSVAISSDGDLIAVGGPENDDAGFNSGHVRLLTYNGNDWVSQGSILSGTPQLYFGTALALSSDGNRVAIGALAPSTPGFVYVYEFDGNDWATIGSTISGETNGDRAGSAVSLSSDGNRLAVGVPHSDLGGVNAGLVRVYEWEGGDWVQLGDDLYGDTLVDFFGSAVHLSADGLRLGVGAPNNDSAGNNAGKAYHYYFDGSNWIPVGNAITGAEITNNFGYAIALSANGSRSIIGGPGNAEGVINGGRVQVYEWNNTAATIDVFLCGTESYISPSGNYTWTSSGTYSDTIPNAAGYDSLLTINLTLDPDPLDTDVAASGATLTANTTGAIYQWLDCNNNFTALADETSQSFTATVSGDYAVEISQNGCVDTSDCINVIITDVYQPSESAISIYPNPTTGIVFVGNLPANTRRIEVVNCMGQRVSRIRDVESVVDLSFLPKGVYFLAFEVEQGREVARVVRW